MNKIAAFLLMLNVALISKSGFAQFKVSSIQISLSNLIGQNYTSGETNSVLFSQTDTSSFSIYVHENINTTFDGKLIQYNYDKFAPKGFAGSSSHKAIHVSIDPINKVILQLTVAFNDTTFDTYDHYYYNSNDSYLECKSLPFSYSIGKDSISANVNGTQIRNILLSTIKYSMQYDSFHTFSKTTSMPIDIPDNSLFEILISGNGPLDVKNNNKSSINRLVNLNLANKTIVINGLIKNIGQLPCFDLLGRKHNLEFLGTDGTASTYSLRSLPRGVYFVSDGKEMVKFLIGE